MDIFNSYVSFPEGNPNKDWKGSTYQHSGRILLVYLVGSYHMLFILVVVHTKICFSLEWLLWCANICPTYAGYKNGCTWEKNKLHAQICCLTINSLGRFMGEYKHTITLAINLWGFHSFFSWSSLYISLEDHALNYIIGSLTMVDIVATSMQWDGLKRKRTHI